jgi:hypothetical protein
LVNKSKKIIQKEEREEKGGNVFSKSAQPHIVTAIFVAIRGKRIKLMISVI